MKEAKQRFFDLHPGESVNTQSEEFEKYRSKGLIRQDDYYIGSIDDISNSYEMMELNFSNNFICDYILEIIEKDVDNDELRSLLNNCYVGFVTECEDEKASAYPVLDNDYLVTITSRLYYSLLNYGDVLAAKLLYDYGYVNENETEFVNILEELCVNKIDDIEVQLLIDLHFESNEKKDLVPVFDRISNEIFEVSLGFVIGHEIGHHYYYHSGKNIEVVRNKMDIGKSIKEYIDELSAANWDEMLADGFAFKFVMQFVKSDYKSEPKLHQILGIFIALLYLSKCNDPFIFTNKHPATIIRLISARCEILNRYRSSSYNIRKILNYIDWLFRKIHKTSNTDTDWWNFTIDQII